MTAVAFVGLGAMGGRMARRLVDAGYQVTVWNRTAARCEPLVALGAQAAESPAAAAARADVTITMVSDPAALWEVSEGPEGIAAGIDHSATLIEMSTVGPAGVTRLATMLPDGVVVLDAPVLGSVSEAEAGDLGIFVGGPPESVERWRPLLSTLGSPRHLGPTGAGAAAKLAANLTLLGVLGVLGEAIALAQGVGLSREATFEVLSATPLGAQAERRRDAIETGSFPPRFALSLARKDADLILDAAAAAGLDMGLSRAARDWLVEAEAAGLGDQDYTAVLAHITENG
ncbi:MAG TPA: NAD(P)-dependent oxidoreductase [Solirubrobacteraceae bacterium]|nr:NAD(P)-dependent oxidoreductase [Solirubrobacteraceae bacterium]